MPEGHSVHRTAKQFQKLLLNQSIQVSSPQGRFTDAGLISGQALTKSEAWGKQLLLHFESAAIRVHLGIYGKWSFTGFSESPPEPFGQVRARFLSSSHVVDLRGPTACEVIGFSDIPNLFERLGPDPLRPDPRGESRDRFVERVLKRKVPIGQLLMDQSVLAGVGNVYRAELLFRAQLSPFTPGQKLPAELVGSIWDDASMLMPLGVKTGLMLTRAGYLKGRPKKDERYNVYKREGLPCRQCGSNIAIDLMQARKLYWCPKCQA
uniref:Fpg/Nei family DNA glycosylase n=1 Tax=Aquiluna sp. TaxID=2053504 RepID=UPI0040477AFE